MYLRSALNLFLFAKARKNKYNFFFYIKKKLLKYVYLQKCPLEKGINLTSKEAKKTIRNHRNKQVAAIVMTLYVNSRVSRIYQEAESRFARWYREGDFFRKRNESLYVEVTEGGNLQVPEDSISMDDAYLVTCIAGECLAEAQGEMLTSKHTEHERLIAKVDCFRESRMNILERIKMEEIESDKGSI